MEKIILLSLMLALAACTTQLSESDRVKLDGAYSAAQQAQIDAREARAAAERAAAAAEAASVRADRIFREGQNK